MEISFSSYRLRLRWDEFTRVAFSHHVRNFSLYRYSSSFDLTCVYILKDSTNFDFSRSNHGGTRKDGVWMVYPGGSPRPTGVRNTFAQWNRIRSFHIDPKRSSRSEKILRLSAGTVANLRDIHRSTKSISRFWCYPPYPTLPGVSSQSMC
jgi:hypothetical protein